jgi:hypothetical protein
MDEMNTTIYIVDREDQVKWYVDPLATSFHIDIKSDHKGLRDWLADMTTGVVVISGQGKMPKPGTNDNVTQSLFYQMNQNRYRLYFADDQDAMLFKLTWGGK